MKITAKFRASRRLRFEDTKRIMSPEIRPKSFGTFEKQAPGNAAHRQEHSSPTDDQKETARHLAGETR